MEVHRWIAGINDGSQRNFWHSFNYPSKTIESQTYWVQFIAREIHGAWTSKVVLNYFGQKTQPWEFLPKNVGVDILIKLDEIRKGGAHKGPDLYQFDGEKYQLALENGFSEGWWKSVLKVQLLLFLEFRSLDFISNPNP